MAHQEALTVIAKIKSGEIDSLKQTLVAIGEDAANNAIFPFVRLDSVHFARLLILPESQDLKGETIRAQLVLSTNIDAPMEAHLYQLANAVGSGLDAVFGHCEGYPSNPTPNGRLAFLRANMRESSAFYVNTVGRTLKQVRQEAQLRDAIEAFLDAEADNLNLHNKAPAEISQAILDFVNGEPSLHWVKEPKQQPEKSWKISQKINKIGVPLALLALAPAAIPFLPLYALVLRLKERSDVPDHSTPTGEHLREIAAGEDHFSQNPFSGVGFIKPGIFRGSTVRFVLWLTKYGANHIYNSGALVGVRTIHFARWVLIDEGRRTLFMSNYDGSRESYMSDFIDKVAWGLNAVFSNGDGWPKTDWLVKGGAENELEFKNFLRSRQLPTQVWYTAYGDLTGLNIANNADIREGLSKRMNRQETEEWLQRF